MKIKILGDNYHGCGYRTGYAPQGWLDSEDRQTAIQRKMVALLEGKISLPITTGPNVGTTSAAPTASFTPPPGFPPPPA